jgi:hypothetical protein
MLKNKLFLVILAPFLFLVFFNSCEDSFTNIGSSLLPQNGELIIQTDTIRGIKTKNVINQKLLTDDQINFVVGDLADDFFGEIRCSFITGFVPDDYDTAYMKYRTLIEANLYILCDHIESKEKSSLQFSISAAGINGISNKNGIERGSKYYSNEDFLEYYTDFEEISSKSV